MAECNKVCRSCVYVAQLANKGLGEGAICCDYIGRTGHRRPCPAGDGCTEFTPRKGAPYNGFRQQKFHLPKSHKGWTDSVTGKVWWAFDPEEAYKLWEEGKNDKWIGALLGCTGTTVGQWRKSRGLGVNYGRRKNIREQSEEMAGVGRDLSSGDSEGQID